MACGPNADRKRKVMYYYATSGSSSRATTEGIPDDEVGKGSSKNWR
jgi:hypothetical protein